MRKIPLLLSLILGAGLALPLEPVRRDDRAQTRVARETHSVTLNITGMT